MSIPHVTMHLIKIIQILALVSCAQCRVEVRRGGWLNRVVHYHKERFLKDFKQLAPIKINATIIPRPGGYQDSDKWNFKSVLRLLVLIKESDPASPVRRVVRRMMAPTRRIMMNKKDSFKYFPSLGKQIMNEMYYDFDSDVEVTPSEYFEETDIQQGPIKPVDNGVVFISNPVEAKLPSAAISLKLLQDILLNRAIAARQMSTSTGKPIIWVPKNITEDEDDEIASGDGIDETTEVTTEDEQQSDVEDSEDVTTPTGSAENGDEGVTAASVEADGDNVEENNSGDKDKASDEKTGDSEILMITGKTKTP